jgi:hypothetical protein
MRGTARTVKQCISSYLECASNGVSSGLDQRGRVLRARSHVKYKDYSHVVEPDSVPGSKGPATLAEADELGATSKTLLKAGRFLSLSTTIVSGAADLNAGEDPGRVATRAAFSAVAGRAGQAGGAALCSELGPVAIGCGAVGGALASAGGDLLGGVAYDLGSGVVDDVGGVISDAGDTISDAGDAISDVGDALGL